MKSFDPATPAKLEIIFKGKFERALPSAREVLFGPAASAQAFTVEGVNDVNDGRALARDVWTLEDVGCAGANQRLVTLAFDAELFTKELRSETDPEKRVPRLRKGLQEVRAKIEEVPCLETATASEVLAVYNLAKKQVVQEHEALLGAIAGRATIALQISYRDATDLASKPTTATLLLQLETKLVPK